MEPNVPHVPQSDIHPGQSQESAPRKRRAGWWIIGGVTILAVVGIAVLARATGSDSGPGTFTLNGSLTLTDSSIEQVASGCAGTGGYSDIAEGASATVFDQGGTVIAKGHVHKSEMVNSITCRLSFAVEGVPEGHPFYQVEVSHRGKVTFDPDEAKRGVRLSLG